MYKNRSHKYTFSSLQDDVIHLLVTRLHFYASPLPGPAGCGLHTSLVICWVRSTSQLQHRPLPGAWSLKMPPLDGCIERVGKGVSWREGREGTCFIVKVKCHSLHPCVVSISRVIHIPSIHLRRLKCYQRNQITSYLSISNARAKAFPWLHLALIQVDHNGSGP